MIGQENTIGCTFKNLNYKTNHKNQIFIKEDLLKEFEEYKYENDLRMKNNNFLIAKLKTASNNPNDKSFNNKSSTNGDSKSLDGLSITLNKYNKNSNNSIIDNSNKNLLLYELLESKNIFYEIIKRRYEL